MDGLYQTMAFTYGTRKLRFTVELKEQSEYSFDSESEGSATR